MNGKTYTQVIQKVVDAFTYYQSGPATGNRYGGWRYFAGENDSDMSTTQWPVIGYLFAGQVPGVTIPNGTVKTALQAWMNAVQYPVPYPPNPYFAGAVDYQPGIGLVNATHAGSFLLAHLFAGGGGNMANALSWLNTNWTYEIPGYYAPWTGNEGQPYVMWAVYKGLEANFGTSGAGPITNLHAQTTSLDPGAVWNWWEDYCQFLCLSQNGDGSWPGYSYWDQAMEAAWYINILNATATGPVVPLPGTVGLLGTGLVSLLGAGWWRRRKA